MSESKPNLVALIKLEFYKKQKNWLFSPQVIPKNVAKPASDRKSKVLNKTYSVDNEDSQEDSPMLNDAFLDSGHNTSPEDIQCTPKVLKATGSDSDIWSEIDKKEFRSQDTFSPTKHIYYTQENLDKGLDINFNEPVPNRNHANLNREFIEAIDREFVGIPKNVNSEVNNLNTQEPYKCEYNHSYRLRKLLENAKICEQLELENMKNQPPQTNEDIWHNENMQMAEFIFRPQDFPNLPQKPTLRELIDAQEKTEWVDSYKELDPNVGSRSIQSQKLPPNEVIWPNQQDSNGNWPMKNKPLGPNAFHWPVQNNQPDPNITNAALQKKRLGPNVANWLKQNIEPGLNVANGPIQNDQLVPNLANWPMQNKELNSNVGDWPMASKQLEPSGGWPKQSEVWMNSFDSQMLENGVQNPPQEAMDYPDGIAEEQQWCDSEQLLEEAVCWLQREGREIQSDMSSSSDSAAFMRGAAAAPHSSELDLRASNESLSSLSSRTEIRSLVKRHTAALRTLLIEANSMDNAQMKSSSVIVQQKPRNIWTNIAPNYTSYDELPTRDIGPILLNADSNLTNVRPIVPNGSNLPNVGPNLSNAECSFPKPAPNLSNVKPKLPTDGSNLTNGASHLPKSSPPLPNTGSNLTNSGLNLSNVTPLSREKTFTAMDWKNDIFLAGSFRDLNTFEMGAKAGRGRGRLARPMRF